MENKKKKRNLTVDRNRTNTVTNLSSVDTELKYNVKLEMEMRH